MGVSTYARRKLFARDHGICALCGCDADFPRRVRSAMGWSRSRILFHPDAFQLVARAWVEEGWEADHIVPLAEGGTHDLSNYRTLCIQCHKEQTRLLAGRLAAKRKADATTQAALPFPEPA